MQDNRPETIEGLTQTDHDRLVAENAKWRERVPRLAAALQARTEELDVLKSGPESSATTSGARQALVEETQEHLEHAKQRYRKSEGELKSRDVQIEDLSSDVSSWKSKWSDLANSLDAQEREFNALKIQLQDAEEDRQSLRTRNEDVLQTAEMAHQEIEVLTSKMFEWQNLHSQKEQELATLEDKFIDQKAVFEKDQQELSAKLNEFQIELGESEELGLQLSEAKETLAKREQRVEDLDRKMEEQDAMLERFRNAAEVADGREKQLQQEIREVEVYREKAHSLESELQQMRDESKQIQQALEKAGSSEKALAEEVSDLAAGRQQLQDDCREATREKNQALENLNVFSAEANARDALNGDLEVRLKAKTQQVSELKSELEAAESKQADTHAHVQLLSDSDKNAADVMLKEKDSLIEELEKQTIETDQKNQRCLSAIESERDGYSKRAANLEGMLLEIETENVRLADKLTDIENVSTEDQPRVDRLMGDIRRLEDSLRKRAQDMNDSEWKNTVGNNKQDQTLLVLNQQLQDTRSENQRLVAKLRQLDTAVVEQPVAPKFANMDDLTQIKGIGPKLASQLNELGVFRVEQIAGLDDVDIEDDHLLHPFKTRMNRDNWVGQALQITS